MASCARSCRGLTAGPERGDRRSRPFENIDRDSMVGSYQRERSVGQSGKESRNARRHETSGNTGADTFVGRCRRDQDRRRFAGRPERAAGAAPTRRWPDPSCLESHRRTARVRRLLRRRLRCKGSWGLGLGSASCRLRKHNRSGKPDDPPKGAFLRLSSYTTSGGTTAARRGKLHIQVDIVPLKQLGERLDRALSRLALSIVTAALVIGSAIVMTVERGPSLHGGMSVGWLGFIAAIVGGIWVLISIWRSGGKR